MKYKVKQGEETRIVYEVGDWVTVVDSERVYEDIKDAVGHTFSIATDIASETLERFNEGNLDFCIDPANKYYINYKYSNIRPATQEEIKKVTSSLKVGDWVSFERGGIAIISRIKEWGETHYCALENGMHPFKHSIKRAAMKDIEAHLIKEAEARGFIEGNYFKSTIDDNGAIRLLRPYDPFDKITWYYSGDDTLRSDDGLTTVSDYTSSLCSNPAIYTRGVWCEVVEKPIMVGTNKVNFNKDTSGEVVFVHIGCKTYSAIHILQLFEMLTKLGIDSISTEGEVVEISKIEEIVSAIHGPKR